MTRGLRIAVRVVGAVLVLAPLVLLVVAATTRAFGEPAMKAAILLLAAVAVTVLRVWLRTRVRRRP